MSPSFDKMAHGKTSKPIKHTTNLAILLPLIKCKPNRFTFLSYKGEAMKIFILISIVTFLILGQLKAKASPVIPNQNTLEQIREEGQFFSIRISKDDPIRIYVVGREEAKFDLSKLKLTVRRLKPYPGKTLTIDQQNSFFTIRDSKDFNKSTDVEIETKMNNQSETFRIKIDKRVP